MTTLNVPLPLILATQAGGTTIDCDNEGGNPFASALIEYAGRQDIPVHDFQQFLEEETKARSHGYQIPEVFSPNFEIDWRLHGTEIPRVHSRLCMVLMVSDYANPTINLRGAAWDELRISAMFAKNGFSVIQGVKPQRSHILFALDEFKAKSTNYDYSIIYATGHGCQSGEVPYLLPCDYPFPKGYDDTILAAYGISVELIAKSCSARMLNLAFFAGCRSLALTN
jgi:hypothetical protein